MRPHGTAQQLEARRLRAAKLLQEGKGVSEVARLVGAAKSSVSRWKGELEEGGVEALKPKPVPGRPAWLSEKQKERLVKLLVRGARKAGYANDLWTGPRVAALIEWEFGVEYHPHYVWEILRRLGWTYQKPEQRAREGDEAAIARWRKENWPRVKKGGRTSS